MTVSASIAFAQGANVGAPGVALIGITGSSVVVSNGNNAGVLTLNFTIVDVPPGSAVPIGLVQSGTSTTYTWTPDIPGGYIFQLEVFDSLGNFAIDYRVFQVPETSGRIIPPFKATDASLNFIISSVMNLRGWAPFQGSYDKEVDILAGAISAPTDVFITAAGTYTVVAGGRYFVNLGAAAGNVILNTSGLTIHQSFYWKIEGTAPGVGVNLQINPITAGSHIESSIAPGTLTTVFTANVLGESATMVTPDGTNLWY